MEKHKQDSYKQHLQFPFIGIHTEPVYPSYMEIGGSGVVGNGGPESPMSNYEDSESNEGASMNTGSGAAAGAAPTFGGSGVA